MARGGCLFRSPQSQADLGRVVRTLARQQPCSADTGAVATSRVGSPLGLAFFWLLGGAWLWPGTSRSEEPNEQLTITGFCFPYRRRNRYARKASGSGCPGRATVVARTRGADQARPGRHTDRRRKSELRSRRQERQHRRRHKRRGVRHSRRAMREGTRILSLVVLRTPSQLGMRHSNRRRVWPRFCE